MTSSQPTPSRTEPPVDASTPRDPPLSSRALDALKGSRNFGEFRSKRRFVFVHLFAGKRDVLGEAVAERAKAEGIQWISRPWTSRVQSTRI